MPSRNASAAGREPDDVGAWLATFLGRFARIRPFASANGRAGRLAAALLLRRHRRRSAGHPARARRRLPPRIDRGGKRRTARTGALIADALLQSCLRLLAAAGDEPLEPLRALAGSNYAALIKAARRGRLATVVRDGRVYTTAAWIADYRSEVRPSR